MAVAYLNLSAKIPMQLNEETTYKLLKLLAQQPGISQRELAEEMGFSVGKINYCLKALMDKGWVKARNFKNSNHKIAYAYVFTPKGLREKTRITGQFLKRKVREYEALKREIEYLRQEVSESS